MGCLLTKQFNARHDVPGQGREVFKLAGDLRMTPNDLNHLFTAFCKVDLDGSGQVSVDEFIVMHGISQEYVGELVFKIFDNNHDGQLNFYEYVHALWNYLSFNKKDLSNFLFDIFDTDGSNEMSYDEVRFMFHVLWTFEPESHLQATFQLLDRNKDHIVDRKELAEFAIHNNMIMFPAFEVQDILRRSTLGDARWTELESKRPMVKFEEDKNYYAADRRRARQVHGLRSALMSAKKSKNMERTRVPERYEKLITDEPPKASKDSHQHHNGDKDSKGKGKDKDKDTKNKKQAHDTIKAANDHENQKHAVELFEHDKKHAHKKKSMDGSAPIHP